MPVRAGILLPDTLLASAFFAVFSAFVGINTVIYVVLAIAKILPKIYFTDWIGGRNRRATARSIYAVGPGPVRPPGRLALTGGATKDHQLAHEHQHERHTEDADVDERHRGDA